MVHVCNTPHWWDTGGRSGVFEHMIRTSYTSQATGAYVESVLQTMIAFNMIIRTHDV